MQQGFRKQLVGARYSPTVVSEIDALGTRYNIVLGYDPMRETFHISITNLNVTMETKDPTNCAYKLTERGLSGSEAKVLEDTIREYLLPQLNFVIGRTSNR